jgi:lipoprotein NlpI
MKPALNSLLCLLLLTGCQHVQREMFLADVRINDKPVRFAYDTGAGETVMWTHSAKRLGLKVFKPPSSPKLAPGCVKIGHTELCRFNVGHETFQLKLATVHLPWPWGGLMDTDGVIGWPDLKSDFMAFDTADDSIKNVDGLPQDTNGWTRLPLYRHTGVLALEIPRADGKTGVLQVDTGSAEGASLSPARWKEWRATHPHAHGSWLLNFMPGSGPAIGRQYEADDLVIGPLTWKRVTIRKARPTEMAIAEGGGVVEASIGLAALRQLNLIIDRTNQMAYVRRSPDWVLSCEATRQKAQRRATSSTNSTVRLNFQAHEYADLAQAALDSGKFDDAITNLTRLLELQPDNAGALAARGELLFRLHAAEGSATNLDRALSDLSRALELDAGITYAYYGRGSIYYLTQRWDDALRDYQRFCQKAPDQSNYPRFYVWLIRARKGEQAAADQELCAWFGPGQKVKADRWQRNVSAFLLGAMSEADFLGASRRGYDSGRQCEAWFYAGMKRCLSGDAATARDYFQKCLATGRKDYEEYNLAAAELRLLERQSLSGVTLGCGTECPPRTDIGIGAVPGQRPTGKLLPEYYRFVSSVSAAPLGPTQPAT